MEKYGKKSRKTYWNSPDRDGDAFQGIFQIIHHVFTHKTVEGMNYI